MDCVLDVEAAEAVELIRVAGGWLCDRAMAGWTVTVRVPNLDHARSLSIIGVTTRASTVEADALVVHGAVGYRHGCVRHRVSRAARAFKARALLAAGLPPTIVDLETFWLGPSSNFLVARECAHTQASALASP
ncbi:hypothetical protein QGN32_03120 [Mycolicibacterium sp. ND9-15]|uniref:hypothetical protein n=1 Tax=Mycolicibacterium sp. ND9-15 TaxID=3042320 RepID=UPI002DD943D1|nr:hypothetical protein [Mycolicibacterium sp. ND9-15]WSE56930.1 hypothetical protein QGN32_03120 [Mycolicibacterium sp. ND9-15]